MNKYVLPLIEFKEMLTEQYAAIGISGGEGDFDEIITVPGGSDNGVDYD